MALLQDVTVILSFVVLPVSRFLGNIIDIILLYGYRLFINYIWLWMSRCYQHLARRFDDLETFKLDITTDLRFDGYNWLLSGTVV